MRNPDSIPLSFVSCLSVLCLTGHVLGAEAMSTYLDRSYYTIEREAIVVCSFGLPAEALEERALVVTDARGNVLGQCEALSPETRIPLDISALPTGKHALKIEFRRRTGQALAPRALVLVKRPPRPGLEWKIDKINRVFLRDGKPFFVHGLIMAGSEADYRAAAEIGFNTVHTWMRGRKPEQAAEYVRSAAKHGLLTIINLDGFCRGVKLDTLKDLVSPEELESAQRSAAYAGRSPKKFTYGMAHPRSAVLKKLSDQAKVRLLEEYYQKNEAAFTEAIALAKDSPTLLGYCLYDEPASSLSVLLGRLFYRRVQEVDGYHPSFVVYSSHIPKGDEWVDWMECLGTDPYWTPGGSGNRGSVNYVSKITYFTRKRADAWGQVTWSVPMGEYWSGIRKRAIMPKEQFC